jgi:hypothetical protein
LLVKSAVSPKFQEIWKQIKKCKRNKTRHLWPVQSRGGSCEPPNAAKSENQDKPNPIQSCQTTAYQKFMYQNTITISHMVKTKCMERLIIGVASIKSGLKQRMHYQRGKNFLQQRKSIVCVVCHTSFGVKTLIMNSAAINTP